MSRQKRQEHRGVIYRGSEIIAELAGLQLPPVCSMGVAQIISESVISDRWIVTSLRAAGICGNPDGSVFHFGLPPASLSLFARRYVHSRCRARVCTQNVRARCFYLPRVVEEGRRGLRERQYQRLGARYSLREIFFRPRQTREKRLPLLRLKGRLLQI